MFKPITNTNDFLQAQNYFYLKDYSIALEYFNKFKKEQLDSSPYSPGSEKGPSPFLFIDYHIGVANCFKKLGDLENAVENIKEAANFCQRHMGRQSSRFIEIKNVYAAWKSELDDEKNLETSTSSMGASR
ncbi:MAG: hypothetical protein P1U74_10205 [Legionellaceae bacterium]|nr:hypothetical protein [Legionellaceae bacterium]